MEIQQKEAGIMYQLVVLYKEMEEIFITTICWMHRIRITIFLFVRKNDVTMLKNCDTILDVNNHFEIGGNLIILDAHGGSNREFEQQWIYCKSIIWQCYWYLWTFHTRKQIEHA